MSKESWQNIHQRGQQSNAVWNTFNAAFTVGTLTLALHQADVAALPAAGQARTSQEDVVDEKRAERDATLATIKDLGTRFPRVMDGALEPGDPMHSDLDDIRNYEPDGLDSIIRRGERTLSCWNKINTHHAVAVPVLPPITVGAITVATLAAALTGLQGKTQAVEDARSVLSGVRAALRGLAERVDRNNKRWLAAWEGTYPVGTPENDALSQIDTESGSSGGGTPPPPPPPVPPGVATLSVVLDSGGEVAILTMVATGATVFNVYQRSPSEVTGGLVASEVGSPWSTGVLGAGSGEWAWHVAGTVGGVEGPMSDIVSQIV